MNKIIALAALAFSFVALPAWSSAHACGGYGDIDAQTEAIESAVRTHFERSRQRVVLSIEHLGFAAGSLVQQQVRVFYARGDVRFAQLVRLDATLVGWRVVSVDRPSRV